MTVSVPLRGVGCFNGRKSSPSRRTSFRPLAGCGLFRLGALYIFRQEGFRPLAGVSHFSMNANTVQIAKLFPSPCGVFSQTSDYAHIQNSVSVPLRGELFQ